jgi:hypothetical protein
MYYHATALGVTTTKYNTMAGYQKGTGGQTDFNMPNWINRFLALNTHTNANMPVVSYSRIKSVKQNVTIESDL